jgi:hypothetical protein
MKRMTVIVAMCALTLFAASLFAQEKAAKTAMPEAKSMTLKGEIVCMGCYMGHGAKGDAHKSCATKCIGGGMPMGLLTADGSLYLLTMSHATADPYNSAKEMAAGQVTVTGPVFEKSGMKAIEVDEVKMVGGDQKAPSKG